MQFFGSETSTLKSVSHLQLNEPTVFSHICRQPPPADEHSSMSAIRDQGEQVCHLNFNVKRKQIKKRKEIFVRKSKSLSY